MRAGDPRPGEHFQRYLGDGVYASMDEMRQIWLRVDRGMFIQEIALEPEVLLALRKYEQDCYKALEKAATVLAMGGEVDNKG